MRVCVSITLAWADSRITSGKPVLIPLASQLSSRPLCRSEGGRSDHLRGYFSQHESRKSEVLLHRGLCIDMFSLNAWYSYCNLLRK